MTVYFSRTSEAQMLSNSAMTQTSTGIGAECKYNSLFSPAHTLMVLAHTANTTTGCSPPLGCFCRPCCRSPRACTPCFQTRRPPSNSVPAEATAHPGRTDTWKRKRKTVDTQSDQNGLGMHVRGRPELTVCFQLSCENSAGRSGPQTPPELGELKLSAGGIWCLT